MEHAVLEVTYSLLPKNPQVLATSIRKHDSGRESHFLAIRTMKVFPKNFPSSSIFTILTHSSTARWIHFHIYTQSIRNDNGGSRCLQNKISLLTHRMFYRTAGRWRTIARNINISQNPTVTSKARTDIMCLAKYFVASSANDLQQLLRRVMLKSGQLKWAETLGALPPWSRC